MGVSTSAGAIIGITAAPPATYNVTGYDALTFTTIGETTNLGDFGREYAKIEHKPLANRGTTKLKGGYDDGQLQLQIACDESDAGQILLETAAGSDANYFLKVTRQNGVIHYMPVQVMSFRRSIGERDSITSVAAMCEITQVGGVGVVTKKPA